MKRASSLFLSLLLLCFFSEYGFGQSKPTPAKVIKTKKKKPIVAASKSSKKPIKVKKPSKVAPKKVTPPKTVQPKPVTASPVKKIVPKVAPAMPATPQPTYPVKVSEPQLVKKEEIQVRPLPTVAIPQAAGTSQSTIGQETASIWGGSGVNGSDFYSGAFIGIHGGFAMASLDQHWTNLGTDYTGAKGEDSMSANGGLVGIHGVFGHVFPNKYYLGGEIGAGYFFLNATTRSQLLYSQTLKYKMKDSYNLSVRGGILTGNVLLYLKAGGVYTRREITSEFPGVVGRDSALPRSSKRFVPGALLGVGVDVPLTRKLSLGAEAIVTRYKNDKYNHPSSIDLAVKNQVFLLALKLSYKFN